MQLSTQTKSLSAKDTSALMQVDGNETSIVVRDEIQNGGFTHAETIIYYSKVSQSFLNKQFSFAPDKNEGSFVL